MTQQRLSWLGFVLVLALLCAVGFLAMRILRGIGQSANDVVVQCRDGHVFTTDWIPGVSFKAIRLGRDRYQYCPVGDHWTFVTRVTLPS